MIGGNKYFIILFLSIVLAIYYSCERNSKNKYGLITTDDYYIYSYFTAGEELLVKNERDLQDQFMSNEYKRLEEQADKSKSYIQPDMIYMQVVQRTLIGGKYVFIFEKANKLRDVLVIKRLAFECDKLESCLEFPNNCKGYYMEFGTNVPPDLNDIRNGSLTLTRIDLVSGLLTGCIDITVGNDKNISGEFAIYDKNKRLFFGLPASFAKDTHTLHWHNLNIFKNLGF